MPVTNVSSKIKEGLMGPFFSWAGPRRTPVRYRGNTYKRWQVKIISPSTSELHMNVGHGGLTGRRPMVRIVEGHFMVLA